MEGIHRDIYQNLFCVLFNKKFQRKFKNCFFFLPNMRAITKAPAPAVVWITIPPAKSRAPILRKKISCFSQKILKNFSQNYKTFLSTRIFLRYPKRVTNNCKSERTVLTILRPTSSEQQDNKQ